MLSKSLQIRSFDNHLIARRGESTFYMEQMFLYLMAVATLFAAMGEIKFAGFAFRGWAWVMIFGASAFFLTPSRFRAPIRCCWFVWIPWILWMAKKTDFSQREAAQRFFIFLTPVLALWITSSLKNVTVEMIRKSYRLLLIGSVFLYCLAVLQSRSLLALAWWYSIAGIAMTFTLIAIASMCDINKAPLKSYTIFALCLIIMLVTQSRMPVLVLPALLIIGQKTFSVRTKILILIVIIIAGGFLFHCAPVQENLFHRGYGTIGDALSFDPEIVDFAGRLTAWPLFIGGIENIWLGDGSTSSAEFGTATFAGKWAHPHNEYIRILFDYGIVGIVLLAIPIATTLISLYKRSRSVRESNSIRWLYAISINGIIGMLLLGISGNSLMYIAYIGNMLFATIGCTYSCAQKE